MPKACPYVMMRFCVVRYCLMVTCVAPKPYSWNEASCTAQRGHLRFSSSSNALRNTPSPLPWINTIFCPNFFLLASITSRNLSSCTFSMSVFDRPLKLSSSSAMCKSCTMMSSFSCGDAPRVGLVDGRHGVFPSWHAPARCCR